MTYAIISVGGKQYRVREGQRLLVDRVHAEEGTTITPTVLMVGGDGGAELTPGITVTARVVAHPRGPKIVIGKHRQRTGFRRRTGFRAALTQIEIESIGAAKKSRARKDEAAPAEEKPKRTRKPKAEAAPAAETPAPEAAEVVEVAEETPATEEES